MNNHDLSRWLAKIEVNERGCFVWTGYKSSRGYATWRIGSRRDGTRQKTTAHRVAYEHFIGPVPEGLELDHLCGNPSCVNPYHLEPVTHSENVMRAVRLKRPR